MKLIKTKYKIRCETGGCRNFADYALYVDRCGIHSSIYICRGCVEDLKTALSEENACGASEETEMPAVGGEEELYGAVCPCPETPGKKKAAAAKSRGSAKRGSGEAVAKTCVSAEENLV